MEIQMNPHIEAFYDKVTGTVSYVVYDAPRGRAALIDPVLDFDPKSGRTHTTSADRLIRFVREQGLQADWILETHAHADHLSAAHHLKQALGGKIAIGDHIRQVQGVFKQLFNLDSDFPQDGSQFDHLFAEDEVFAIGGLSARALFVPGHTPADMAYQIGNAVFVGDTLFMPDVGTARCDFPGGDAHTLYRSIRKLLALPADTRLFMCHDYPPNGREARWQTTVAQQRAHNIHVHDGVGEDDFVAMRQKRDAGLEMPVLILPSIQVNIRAGTMPAAESNGVSYLKIPINVL
jgi:glyoxylase-like metal-dependent hydrolase (beta-lactamase superfamily II)